MILLSSFSPSHCTLLFIAYFEQMGLLLPILLHSMIFEEEESAECSEINHYELAETFEKQ
jgi:hypothetical protein